MQLFHSFNEINWLAVAIITVFSFVLGAFWHSSVLFKKTWIKDSGTIYNASNHGNPLVIFGLSGLLHLIAITALAALIGSSAGAVDGLITGLMLSVIWVSTSMAVTYIFVGRTFKLFLIDAGFYVVFYSLAGFVLGAWQ